MPTQEPEFRFFPWKALAFSMPALAALAAILARREGKDDFEILSIAMAVLGAGNGYLLAAAIGDFGRSLLAIPVGAGAGFLFSAAIQIHPVCVLLFIILLMFVVKTIMTEFSSAPIRSVGCMGGTGIGVLIATPALIHSHESQAIGVLMLFPLVMCAVTALMPARDTLGGRIAAMNAGVVASLYGMAAAIIGVFCFGIPAGLATSLWFRGRGDPLMIAASVLGAGVGNYVCIKILFRAASRVSR